MLTSIATVCLSGSLVEKLHACAAAGFDGVEIFEPDLVAAEESPEEIRALADRLGLTLDLYQPLRDAEGVTDEVFAGNLRRAEAKFALMNRLGIDLMLVCSNVATASIDSDEVSADQLSRLGDLAGAYGVRLAFEALAWGTYVDDYRRAWRIVERADHPEVGVCLDSFHILSRGHDLATIAEIPAEKIFFLQLADAPALSMDVLSWSRHHRLFPGEGAWDLGDFVGRVAAAGYQGPYSLEVFNDTFRQTDTRRTAAHAHRSLVWVADQARRWAVDPARGGRGTTSSVVLPRVAEAAPPTGIDFVEIKAGDTSAYEELLGQLGFTFRGRHRTKPVTLWTAGAAKIILNEQHARDQPPHLAAVGFTVPDAAASLRRAYELGASSVYRRTYATEFDLPAVAAPDGTQIFLSGALADADGWVAEFEHGEAVTDSGVIAVDHVNLAQPWQDFDEAILFYSSVLGLSAAASTEVAGPRGLVRSQVMRTDDGAVRIPLNVVPPVLDAAGLPQHIAFGCGDVIGLARQARDRGLQLLPVPDNYYDDLAARFGLDADRVAELRELSLLYDRDEHGEFVHFYTVTIGELFVEVLERRDGYDGYGAPNAPVRLAAQRRLTS
ncbi:MAG TPA: TIM barrel protein [Microlunatus sp.]